ncbi:hypothetical protein BJN45_15120 [Azonexus hydrophilus]|uniref:Uncharacterized protein n=1 Tax=Azonexus hydrophilus TaxID=418702 RepID=A0A1R1I1L1_9RHOO|nr:hypothetical protein [Azonexus hydrophilus]OMG52603.1 hypothetical protein BJN45_15120 [Azonexus hydrophilus]
MSDTEVLEKAKLNPNGPTVVDAKASYDSNLVLFRPETNEIVVVPQKDAKAFLEEANQMEMLCRNLVTAREKVLGLEENIAEETAKRSPSSSRLDQLKRDLGKAQQTYDKAYEEVKKELGATGYLAGSGNGKELLELIPLVTHKSGSRTKDWARKWTYVRSDKMKNHWRAYPMSGADKSQDASFVKNGKVDSPTLKQQMSSIAPKLKADWGISDAGFFSPGLQAWVETMNRTASENKPFQVGWKVHLLRYFVGCGAALEWQPKSGKVAGKLNGKGEIMLAYGELSSEGFLPDAEGWAWSLQGVKTGKEYLIGCMRFQGGIKLTAAAGASVAAELSLEVDYSGVLPKAKGSRRPKGETVGQRKVSLDNFGAGASAGAEAFAGVKAGCELLGGLQFRNPEKGDKFEYMASVGPKFDAQAGAGVAAHLLVDFKGGKFRVRAKAGLCLGFGAKGEISLEVDTKKIYSFLEWLFHALLNANFEMLQVVSEDAFEAATQLQVMLVNGIQDAYKDVVGKWISFQDQLEREERRIALMKRVLQNPPELRICTPEAHGILLHELTRHGGLTKALPSNTGWNFDVLGERKQAVLQVCKWAQSRRHFENIVQHISATGSKGGFQGNYDGLLRFMEIGPLDSDYDDKLRALYAGLPGEPARGYKVAMNGSRSFDLNHGFGESPTYLAMLRNAGDGPVIA